MKHFKLIWGFILLMPIQAMAYIPFSYDPNHPFLSNEFQVQMDEISNSQISTANHGEMLVDAKPSLKKRIEMIQNARKMILLSTFLFHNHFDPLSQSIAELLIEKHKQGVEVYIIMDYSMSYIDPVLFKRLEMSGIHLTYFNPILSNDPYPFGVFWHEKLVITDHMQSVLGGQNLYDEDYPYIPFDLLKWTDTDLYVEGPVLLDISNHFLETWEALTGEKIEYGDRSLRDLSPEKNFPKNKCRFVYNKAHTGDKYLTQAYLHYIENATHSIIWQGNNLFLNETFTQALIQAQQRGVEVILMTNSFVTSWWQAFWYFYHAFLDRKPFKNTGVEVRLYTEKFNHSKIFYADGVVTSIGSANHDIYSLENDTESTLISYDRNFNASVHEKLMYDLKTTVSAF